MDHQVSVVLKNGERYDFPLGAEDMASFDSASARHWIAESFQAAGLETPNPMGKLLIIDEPSVGIDIKTKAYLHDLIHELAESGTAVLLITSDLTEMVDVADRVAVMDGYRIQGLVENDRNYERVSTAIMGLIHGRKAA